MQSAGQLMPHMPQQLAVMANTVSGFSSADARVDQQVD